MSRPFAGGGTKPTGTRNTPNLPCQPPSRLRVTRVERDSKKVHTDGQRARIYVSRARRWSMTRCGSPPEPWAARPTRGRAAAEPPVRRRAEASLARSSATQTRAAHAYRTRVRLIVRHARHPQGRGGRRASRDDAATRSSRTRRHRTIKADRARGRVQGAGARSRSHRRPTPGFVDTHRTCGAAADSPR